LLKMFGNETRNEGTTSSSNLENIFNTISDRVDIKLAFLGGSKEIPIIEPHEQVSGRLNSKALLGDVGILLPGKMVKTYFILLIQGYCRIIKMTLKKLFNY
jgi:hypothetical protein